MNKDVNKLLKTIDKEDGWRVEYPKKRGSCHIKIFPPLGQSMIVVSHSPSCPREIKNLRSLLKKAGFRKI